MTRSNMIQVKNKTIDWLQTLPQTELENVVDLAVRRKAEVSRESKEEDQRNSDQRREILKSSCKETSFPAEVSEGERQTSAATSNYIKG